MPLSLLCLPQSRHQGASQDCTYLREPLQCFTSNNRVRKLLCCCLRLQAKSSRSAWTWSPGMAKETCPDPPLRRSSLPEFRKGIWRILTNRTRAKKSQSQNLFWSDLHVSVSGAGPARPLPNQPLLILRCRPGEGGMENSAYPNVRLLT